MEKGGAPCPDEGHEAPPPAVFSQAAPQALGELADAQDVALALGDRDDAARIEQVEGVARLDALVVGRERHQMAVAGSAAFEQRPAFGLRVPEMLEEDRRVGVLEIEAGVFLFRLQENVAVGDALLAGAAVEIDVVDAVDPLHVHRKPLEAVGELAGNRRALEAGDLLKVGELRHSMPSHQHSQPSPQAPSVGLSQSSSTKRTSCSAMSTPMAFSESR